MPRFPQVIVVTEETPDNGPPWLEVHSGGGLEDVDIDGTYVAVYHLARVGTVQIKKSFREVQKPAPTSAKRRRRKA